MVMFEQKIAALLIWAMPKNVNQFELQAYLYPDSSLCLAMADVDGGYQVVDLNDQTIELLLKMFASWQSQNTYVWKHCHVVLRPDKSTNFYFSNLDSDFYLSGVMGNKPVKASIHHTGDTYFQSIEIQYQPNMLFDLAIDLALGLNGFEADLLQAKQYFKALTQVESVSLAAYYNWVALENNSNRLLDVGNLDILELLRRVRQSDAAALYVLGLMYHSGYKALQPNIKQAMYYYRRAAALGCPLSRLRVEDLYVGCLAKVSANSPKPNSMP